MSLSDKLYNCQLKELKKHLTRILKNIYNRVLY